MSSYNPAISELCLVSSPIKDEFWLVVYMGKDDNGLWKIGFNNEVIKLRDKPTFYKLVTKV